jgi:tripeptide aminopeptidase
LEGDVVPAGGVDRERLLRTFLDLVAVDSPSGHEREIGEILMARFGGLGCAGAVSLTTALE